MSHSDTEIKVPKPRYPWQEVMTPVPSPNEYLYPIPRQRGKSVHFSISSQDPEAPTPDRKISITRFPSPAEKHYLRLLPKQSIDRTLSFCSKCRNYFTSYAEVADMHGVIYLAERRTNLEKILWAIMLGICLASCMFFLYLTAAKYDNTKTIISFAMNYNPIREVPFPAVTICPEMKMTQEKFSFSLVREKIFNNETLTPEEYRLYCYFYLLCDFKRVVDHGNNSFVDLDFYRGISEIAVPFHEWMIECHYNGNKYNCSKLFSKLYLDEGLCYSFNMLEWGHIFQKNTIHPAGSGANHTKRSTDWTEMYGYKSDHRKNVYPRRGMKTGMENALHLRMRHCRVNLDDCCKNGIQGYRALIHSPANWPRLSRTYLRVPLNGHSMASVYPKRVATSQLVMDYTVEVRRCFFPEERPLKFFQSYTQSNCLLECLANYTKLRCGCVAHHMPVDKKTRICGSARRMCVDKAEDEWEVKELRRQLSAKKKESFGSLSCGCLPQCTYLDYYIDYSSSVKNWSGTNQSIPPTHTAFGDHYKEGCDETLLSVFFETALFRNLERTELFGTAEMIANLGGLIGFFTGLSLLSIIECIYFCTCRIICNRKLYNDWSGV